MMKAPTIRDEIADLKYQANIAEQQAEQGDVYAEGILYTINQNIRQYSQIIACTSEIELENYLSEVLEKEGVIKISLNGNTLEVREPFYYKWGTNDINYPHIAFRDGTHTTIDELYDSFQNGNARFIEPSIEEKGLTLDQKKSLLFRKWTELGNLQTGYSLYKYIYREIREKSPEINVLETNLEELYAEQKELKSQGYTLESIPYQNIQSKINIIEFYRLKDARKKHPIYKEYEQLSYLPIRNSYNKIKNLKEDHINLLLSSCDYFLPVIQKQQKEARREDLFKNPLVQRFMYCTPLEDMRSLQI